MKTVPAQNFPARLLWIMAAPLIWFGHFSLIYALAGFGPAFGLTSDAIRTLCWIATAFALGAIAAFLWRDGNDLEWETDPEDPLSLYATGLGVLSVIAVLMQTFVLAIVP
jgi:hypothetical protein